MGLVGVVAGLRSFGYHRVVFWRYSNTCDNIMGVGSPHGVVEFGDEDAPSSPVLFHFLKNGRIGHKIFPSTLTTSLYNMTKILN